MVLHSLKWSKGKDPLMGAFDWLVIIINLVGIFKVEKIINPWLTSELLTREELHTTPSPTRSERLEPQEVDLLLNTLVREPREFNFLDQPRLRLLVSRRSTMPRTELWATLRDQLPDPMEVSWLQFNLRKEFLRLSLARRSNLMFNRLELKRRRSLPKKNDD